jgi:ribosome biogenesis GTPase
MAKMASNLIGLGWDNRFEDLFLPWAERDCSPGRIIGVQREIYSVAIDNGIKEAKVSGRFVYKAQFKGDFPAVGDWVAIETKAEQPRILAVLPRKSSFVRKLPIKGGRKMKDGMIDGGTTEEQAIAANVDTVFIVTGLDQNFEPRRVERYLTLTVKSGAAPLLILNKADLHGDPGVYVSQLTAIAREIPVYAVSAETGHNMEVFSRYIGLGKTVVFIGGTDHQKCRAEGMLSDA